MIELIQVLERHKLPEPRVIWEVGANHPNRI